MKRFIFIIFFLVILNCVYPTDKKIEASVGINYYEEAHIVIALSQISPVFMFKFIFEQKFKDFSLIHEIHSFLNLFSIYLKNGFFYYTDKTINLEFPLYYTILFNFKLCQYFYFFTGSGIVSKIKYNRYSSGLNYWQSEFKYGLIPLFVIGVNGIFSKYRISLSNYFAVCPSFIFQYKKEEYYTFFAINNFYNNLKFEFSFYFKNKWYIIFSYNNFLDLYMDIYSLFVFINFNNSISTGVGYEF
ncbi:MAG TPA: hypothetical protein PLE45_05525 [Spirochaetota bacterium]|nr:hypothetical protein [Spirochaetota bacterium]HPP05719.1 hypothetical protein [Spirochaetota bacterium]